MIYEVEIGGKKYRVEISEGESVTTASLDGGASVEIDANMPERNVLTLINGEGVHTFILEGTAPEISARYRGERIAMRVSDPRALRSRRAGAAGDSGPKKITAPMPGKVVRIVAAEGTSVEAGGGVIVIEAMKMQNELRSPKAGRVSKIAVAEGATVNPGDTLVIIE